MDISTVEERALMLLEKAYIKQMAGTEDGALNPVKMAFLNAELDKKLEKVKEELNVNLEKQIFTHSQKLIEQK